MVLVISSLTLLGAPKDLNDKVQRLRLRYNTFNAHANQIQMYVILIFCFIGSGFY